MVALPGQLFTNTPIPAHLWFLSKNKAAGKNGKHNCSLAAGPIRIKLLDMNKDWMVLTTINAPRHVMVTGDDLEAWLRGTAEADTMGLQAFFYECDLGAQLGCSAFCVAAISPLSRHLPLWTSTSGLGFRSTFIFRWMPGLRDGFQPAAILGTTFRQGHVGDRFPTPSSAQARMDHRWRHGG
jgi:hypothetical protein